MGACPWNKFAQGASEARLHARDALKGPRLGDLLALDDPAFRTLFTKSPVKRIGRDRFIRNVLYATGNSDDAALIAPVEALLDDPAPVVRGAAVWALSRLSPERWAALREARLAAEEDESVKDEWRPFPLAGEGGPRSGSDEGSRRLQT
ncbi:Epoxyqueuosine reductase [compost metagenome]